MKNNTHVKLKDIKLIKKARRTEHCFDVCFIANQRIKINSELVERKNTINWQHIWIFVYFLYPKIDTAVSSHSMYYVEIFGRYHNLTSSSLFYCSWRDSLDITTHGTGTRFGRPECHFTQPIGASHRHCYLKWI